MPTDEPQLLDVVALLVDVSHRSLRRGEVGTVVERLDSDNFEVEFSDEDGRMYARLAISGNKLMLLHYHPT